MTATLTAIYEDGHLRLLQALELPDHTLVHVKVVAGSPDVEREEWLAHGERCLVNVWDNGADDVYNELLAKVHRQDHSCGCRNGGSSSQSLVSAMTRVS